MLAEAETVNTGEEQSDSDEQGIEEEQEEGFWNENEEVSEDEVSDLDDEEATSDYAEELAQPSKKAKIQ